MRLLSQLKSDTSEAHTRLETSLDVMRRVRTREDYRELLQNFFRLYDPLETKLSAANWTALKFDFPARRKTPLLVEDLLTLGVSEQELALLPRPPELPTLAEHGDLVGCLYVLEGSTLGGQVISRQFRSSLGITPDAGGKFFHGYGSDTAVRWREFGAWAESQNPQTDPAFANAAVRGARECFHAFSLCLMS